MQYRILVDCTADDDHTAKDAGHIIASILPYMVSNIEVDVEKDHADMIYCSHADEQIMGGGS